MDDDLRARRFKILSDESRVLVLEALLDGPVPVSALRQKLGIEPTLLSHHLRVLREEGLVRAERQGKSVIYRLSQGVRASASRALDLGCCRITLR